MVNRVSSTPYQDSGMDYTHGLNGFWTDVECTDRVLCSIMLLRYMSSTLVQVIIAACEISQLLMQ